MNMNNITILKADIYNYDCVSDGVIKYNNDLVSSYFMSNEGILYLYIAKDIENVYKNIENILIDKVSSFFVIDTSNIRIEKVNIRNIYKNYITFEELNENILLCGEYIGYYNSDLDVELINSFGRDETVDIIRELLYEQFEDNLEKFDEGIKIHELKVRIYTASENRIKLYIEDHAFQDKYKFILVKNKELNERINSIRLNLNDNITNRIITLYNLTVKYYSDNLLLLGNFDELELYGIKVINDSKSYTFGYLPSNEINYISKIQNKGEDNMETNKVNNIEGKPNKYEFTYNMNKDVNEKNSYIKNLYVCKIYKITDNNLVIKTLDSDYYINNISLININNLSDECKNIINNLDLEDTSKYYIIYNIDRINTSMYENEIINFYDIKELKVDEEAINKKIGDLEIMNAICKIYKNNFSNFIKFVVLTDNIIINEISVDINNLSDECKNIINNLDLEDTSKYYIIYNLKLNTIRYNEMIDFSNIKELKLGEDNMNENIKVNTEKYGAYGTMSNNKEYNIFLTKEELEKVNKSLGEISEIDKLRSLCCHRDENNQLTIEATDDDKIKCKVCCKEFEMFNLKDSKNVNDTIDKFISLMETVKLSYVDIPDNLKEYFTFLSYDSKEICRKALESYDNFHKNNNHFKKINTYSVKHELLN